jgi:hypothetical protein
MLRTLSTLKSGNIQYKINRNINTLILILLKVTLEMRRYKLNAGYDPFVMTSRNI